MKVPRSSTIHDVARAAGVSVGTVSHVLNGRQKVSDDRRQRVLAAAQAVGYRPNGLARSLRQQRSGVVGFSLPGISSAYYAALAQAFEDVAAQSGQVLMQVMSRGDPDLERDRLGALLDRRVDGILLVPSIDPASALALAAASGTPLVTVGCLAPGQTDGIDNVTLDDRQAMRDAIAHLMAKGHRRFVFLVRDPRLAVTSTRIHALEELIHEHAGNIAAETLAFGDDRARFDRELPARLLAPAGPTAILASNSIVAHWALLALHRHGLAWPDDISVLAFDEPIWGDLTSPPLSILRQPVLQIAATAWNMLMHRRDQPGAPARQMLFPVEIIDRGSIGPPSRKR